MKEKIFMFIIGALVGAIVATGAFIVFNSTSNNTDCSQTEHVKGEQPPEMPSGEKGQPPEIPTESNNESNSN